MDYLPDDNSRYKDVDYWDERYKTEQCYDWLGSFSKFKHLLEQHVKKYESILMLGCGNSSLSGDMYSAGYHSITNIDYSSVCINTMSAREGHAGCHHGGREDPLGGVPSDSLYHSQSTHRVSSECRSRSITEPCDLLSAHTPSLHSKLIRNSFYTAGTGPHNIILDPSRMTK